MTSCNMHLHLQRLNCLQLIWTYIYKFVFLFIKYSKLNLNFSIFLSNTIVISRQTVNVLFSTKGGLLINNFLCILEITGSDLENELLI